MTFTAKILLLGSGELGREFAISAKRLGAFVVACDSYAHAPAMQVADACEVFPMLDAARLRAAVETRAVAEVVTFAPQEPHGMRSVMEELLILAGPSQGPNAHGEPNSRVLNPGRDKKENVAQLWRIHASKKED